MLLNSLLEKPIFTVYLIFRSVWTVLAGEAKEEKNDMQEIAAWYIAPLFEE